MKPTILDCTLRDGGYNNNWRFGRNKIIEIARCLSDNGIQIVELGFLEDSFKYKHCKEDYSFFTSQEDVEKLISDINCPRSDYVVMCRMGKLNLSRLNGRSLFEDNKLFGVRVAIHEDELLDSIEYCEAIREKGYKVFFQPVGLTTFSDKGLEDLITAVSRVEPDYLYIVDTLGQLHPIGVEVYIKFFREMGFDGTIGLHSHNNCQASFACAVQMLNRDQSFVIDSSLAGMGRGAGNLNTELIVQHPSCGYRLKQQAEIAKLASTIVPSLFMDCENWGFDPILSFCAIKSIHPDYYLSGLKNNCKNADLYLKILESIPYESRARYNPEVISLCIKQN